MARTTIPGTRPSHDVRRAEGGRAAVARLALAAGLAASSPSLAQDADALLKEGTTLMGEGKLAEACPKLEESQRVAPSAATLLELASCHEKQGKIATAWQEFIDAEAEARKAGNKRLQANAKARSARLELRIPRLTLKVAPAVEGLELKIDGAPVHRSSFNQPSPIDPGAHTITASAPGKKPWERAASLKQGERKTVTIPALEDDPSGAAAAAATPGGRPPVRDPAGQQGAASQTPAAQGSTAEPEVTTHRAGRFIADVGAGPAFLLGHIDAGSLTNVSSYAYEFNTLSPDGQIRPQIQPCNDDVCQGVYDLSAGLVLGGQAFFGYALQEELHLGARLFGGVRFGDGYVLVGGPSGAMKVGPVWLGLTIVAGGVAQDAPVSGVRGEIPDEALQYNDDQPEIDVDTSQATPLPESEIVGTFAIGGALEVSYPLLDLPSSSWTSGALLVSAWPSVMKGLQGVVVTVPVTIGYRFY